MSNFAFLQAEWPLMYESAMRVEETANTDARTSCFYARRTLEMAVAWLFQHDRSLKLPYQPNLNAFIHEPTFRSVVGDTIFTKANVIRSLGNKAVHENQRMGPSDGQAATRELFHFCYWMARTYGRRSRPDPSLMFKPALLPTATALPTQTVAQLQSLEGQLEERDAKVTALLSDKAALDAELKALRDEVAAVKAANAVQPDTHDYSEAQTRDYYIDLLLREAGWQLTDKNLEVEVSGMPKSDGVNQGKGFVDYVLWGDDGKPLAVVEAKRTRRDAKVGQQQAKLYADCLQAQYGQRPVIFYSNGYEHWMWNDTAYPPRAVQGFFKKQELELMIQRRTSRRPLAQAVINADIIGRYYQTRAVRRIGEAFEKDNLRKALARPAR